jgi:myo-inositol-1-phosphate synthase
MHEILSSGGYNLEIMAEKYSEKSILILAAGAKGAIGSTLAAAVCSLNQGEKIVGDYLATQDRFERLGISSFFNFAGWDKNPISLRDAVNASGVVPKDISLDYRENLLTIGIKPPPDENMDLKSKVLHLMTDIREFRMNFPDDIPVLVNLLPACSEHGLASVSSLESLYEAKASRNIPDLAYVLAGVLSGVPVINFTPNEVELPVVLEEARRQQVPVAGRDGKTGQTYFKMVLASALKARKLRVDGWYSLNILGNADGKNLMEPGNVAGKLKNKTDFLDDVLGYRVGKDYDAPSHKVHIDYYPPRGDAKEAWDVIDFTGIFNMPMSMRLNLQGRDSILAAPLVLDLSRWMAALFRVGRSGPVAELAFYFKKPVGPVSGVTFEEQVRALNLLDRECAGPVVR